MSALIGYVLDADCRGDGGGPPVRGTWRATTDHEALLLPDAFFVAATTWAEARAAFARRFPCPAEAAGCAAARVWPVEDPKPPAEWHATVTTSRYPAVAPRGYYANTTPAAVLAAAREHGGVVLAPSGFNPNGTSYYTRGSGVAAGLWADSEYKKTDLRVRRDGPSGWYVADLNPDRGSARRRRAAGKKAKEDKERAAAAALAARRARLREAVFDPAETALGAVWRVCPPLAALGLWAPGDAHKALCGRLSYLNQAAGPHRPAGWSACPVSALRRLVPLADRLIGKDKWRAVPEAAALFTAEAAAAAADLFGDQAVDLHHATRPPAAAEWFRAECARAARAARLAQQRAAKAAAGVATPAPVPVPSSDSSTETA